MVCPAPTPSHLRRPVSGVTVSRDRDKILVCRHLVVEEVKENGRRKGGTKKKTLDLVRERKKKGVLTETQSVYL